MNALEINGKTRDNVLKIISGLSIEQMNIIPKGFNNNLAWNLGHIIATQYVLIYGLSGLNIDIRDDVLLDFKKGTLPKEKYTIDEIKILKSLLIQTTKDVEKDYESGLFDTANYKVYETSYGVTIRDVSSAIALNCVHEAMHLGIMMSIRKFV